MTISSFILCSGFYFLAASAAKGTIQEPVFTAENGGWAGGFFSPDEANFRRHTRVYDKKSNKVWREKTRPYGVLRL